MNTDSSRAVAETQSSHSKPLQGWMAKHMHWLIVWLVFLVYVLMFIDRVNISVAAKYIMPEYQITQVQMGGIFSAFVFGYAVMQIPGGWLGDRLGSTRILTWAIIWWSAFTAITAIAGDLSLAGVVATFAVVRALIGCGEAAALPNGSRIVANWMDSKRRGFALGFTLSGVAVGAAVAPPLVAWIMVTWGWREAFYISGALGLVVAVVWCWFVSDRPATHRWLQSVDHRSKKHESANSRTQSSSAVPWRAICGRADLWCLTIAYFAFGYVMYIYYSWFFLYLVNVRGFSVLQGGFYTMAPFIAGGITAPLGGWLTDRLNQRFGKRIARCGLGFGCLPLTAAFIVMGSATTDPHLAVLCLSLGAGALYLSIAAYWAAAIDLSSVHSGTVCGFMNTGVNLGGVISPVLTPFLAERFGWEYALYAAAAVALAGALFWFRVHPERPITIED